MDKLRISRSALFDRLPEESETGSSLVLSPSQVTDMFGAGKISEFASMLGLSNEEAAGGLSDALPKMVDNASSGGSLLDSLGGVSGAIGLAGKLFGK